MTTARTVPVTTEMDGDELDALDAWHLARRHGLRKIAVESFVRFRYGDGFTNSRALALQACLAVVPFLLALTGLAADLDEERPARVVAEVVDSLSPGAGSSDALTSAVEESDESERAGEVALVFGLGFALVSMTTAMAQVERGANRIYGIRRDRKALAKYGRAAVLTGVLAGPVGIGFLMIVGGGAFGEAMADSYGWSAGTVQWWNVLRWPIGLTLLVFTIAVLLDHAPRRRQPALSWLALGSGIAVVLSALATVGSRVVRLAERLVRQRLRPARRRLRPAAVGAAVLDRVLPRHRGVRPARGPACRPGRPGRRRSGAPARPHRRRRPGRRLSDPGTSVGPWTQPTGTPGMPTPSWSGRAGPTSSSRPSAPTCPRAAPSTWRAARGATRSGSPHAAGT